MEEHSSAQILLIDDDPDICWGIGRILTRKGFSVTSCGDGIDALRFLKERDFTFVITDINMPEVNGIALLEWIHTNRPRTRVVVISGCGVPVMKRLAMNKGAFLYLEKPVDPSILVHLLEEKMSVDATDSFSGMTQNIDLIDYIQFMLVTRKQAVLEVESHNQERGVIYFDKGNIPHVTVDDVVGQEAFNYLVANFNGGRFNTCAFTPPEVETISLPGEFLLMEAARIKDERSGRIVATQEPPSSEAGSLMDGFTFDEFDLQFPE
ncbi:response regulator [Myxococcota bacterium]|nr:response regulator [Myxococcota bacterium]MBU1537025.1 response regulator [Myxococcota bacterium]